MSTTVFDYIVVGQGLAGSAVAVQLVRRGKKILVFDQPDQNYSSRIAAGLFNPITGKQRLVRTWMADQLFPYLHTFYREVEAETKTRFFHSLPLYRPFISIEEQNEWMAKSADPTFEPYVDKVLLSSADSAVHDPFGGLLLKQCGYLDIKTYIEAVRNLIQVNGTYIRDHFDEQVLIIQKDSVQYKQYVSKRIIFCAGTHRENWFGWLPIRPLKGETICVQVELGENVILNRGVYVVSANQGKDQWRVGATYNFHDDTKDCTPEARLELEDKLRNLIKIPFQFKSQQWGVRPTTPDHRPLLGMHPDSELVSVFNGLGTKGVSLSPYFSEVLVRSLENDIALDKAVDIERYKSVYWSSPK